METSSNTLIAEIIIVSIIWFIYTVIFVTCKIKMQPKTDENILLWLWGGELFISGLSALFILLWVHILLTGTV